MYLGAQGFGGFGIGNFDIEALELHRIRDVGTSYRGFMDYLGAGNRPK